MNKVAWLGLTGTVSLEACSTSFLSHTGLVAPIGDDEDDRGSGRIAA